MAVDSEVVSIVPVEAILRGKPHVAMSVLRNCIHHRLGETLLEREMLEAQRKRLSRCDGAEDPRKDRNYSEEGMYEPEPHSQTLYIKSEKHKTTVISTTASVSLSHTPGLPTDKSTHHSPLSLHRMRHCGTPPATHCSRASSLTCRGDRRRSASHAHAMAARNGLLWPG